MGRMCGGFAARAPGGESVPSGSPEWGEFFIFTMANSFDGESSQRLDKTTEFIEIDIDCQGFDKEMLIGKP